MPNDTTNTNTNTNTISDNAEGLLTAQNAKIQNLEAGLITQGQGLLNLESTQLQILEKMQSINIQLGKLNDLVAQQGSNELNFIPDDFQLQFALPASWITEQNEKNMNMPALPESSIIRNHKYHYHIKTKTKQRPETGVKSSIGGNYYFFAFLCNYQIRFRLEYFCMAMAYGPRTKAQILQWQQGINGFWMYMSNNEQDFLNGYCKTGIFTHDCMESNVANAQIRFANLYGENEQETSNSKNTRIVNSVNGYCGNTNVNGDSTLLGWTTTQTPNLWLIFPNIEIRILRVGEKLCEKDSEYMQWEQGDYDMIKNEIVQ